MARKPQLLDRWGNPVQRSILSQEVAAPTFGGVRSPISGHPADGLNPLRLAQILQEADRGDPIRYLELAETIEERDPHYLGVLGTRKRSVSQIEITVEAASDDKLDVEIADMIRDWLDRDELGDEIFHILDCIGKGFSVTEIDWDTSEGQWSVKALERRDPRHFRFDRIDLTTPVMIGDNGQEEPLKAFKFIYANVKAKSGLPLRSGLARVAAWGWTFKAFAQRDWAIFTQTYGQPLRVGKYGGGASKDDRNTLFNAVANIAGDCAAIIPESMTIDFVETKSVGASSDLYENRIDHLDKQISKAVLGQTATTDAETGGLGSGKEHREFQEVIERADAKALSAILNRDLIRPWVDLEYGPQKRYPRLKIARPEPEDLQLLASSLGSLVPIGLKVKMSEVRDKFGLAEPAEGDEILGQIATIPPQPDGSSPGEGRSAPIERDSAKFKRVAELPGVIARQAEEIGHTALKTPPDPAEIITAQLEKIALPGVAGILGQIEAMMAAAGSMEEFREMLNSGFDQVDASDLAKPLVEALTAAELFGRVEVIDENV